MEQKAEIEDVKNGGGCGLRAWLLISGIWLLLFTFIRGSEGSQEPLFDILYSYSFNNQDNNNSPNIQEQDDGWTASFSFPWDKEHMEEGMYITFFYYYELPERLARQLTVWDKVQKDESWPLTVTITSSRKVLQDDFYRPYKVEKKELGRLHTRMFRDSITKPGIYRFYSAVLPVKVVDSPEIDSLHLLMNVKDVSLLCSPLSRWAYKFGFEEMMAIRTGKEHMGILVFCKEDEGLLSDDRAYYSFLALSVILIVIGLFGFPKF